MTTANLVREIVSLINEDVLEDTDTVEAVLSFDDRTVPQPVDKIYFAFLIGQDNVSVLDDGTQNACQLTQLTISMNCYAPPGENAIEIAAHAEDVLSKVNETYSGIMQGYEIGTAAIDDYLKALKVPCKMLFRYEQCPAYQISESVILPFADFFCKTHVLDTTLHLNAGERQKLSEPFVAGTYVGLGAYNPVTVSLTFAPKLVLIAPQNAPFAELDAVHNTLLCRAAVAATGVSDSLIALQSGGFTVTQPETIPYDGAIRSLNEANRTYFYVAFR